VTPGRGSDFCSMSVIEASPYTDNPHVAFSWRITRQISKKVTDISYRVGHTYRNSQGVWQPLDSISTPRHNQGPYTSSFNPAMAFASDGAAYTAWREHYPLTSSGIMYSYCPAEGGPWTRPAWLSSDTSGTYQDAIPSVAVDEWAGLVHVAWKRGYSGEAKEIWWRSGDLGGDGPQAQPVALPQSRVELFPNPATAGRVTVRYALPHAGPMTVTLLDVSGRAVRRSAFDARSSRVGSFALDASGLHAGVYILRLESGTTSLTQKLVIQ